MKLSDFCRWFGICAAVAALAACGGLSAPFNPPTSPQSVAQPQGLRSQISSSATAGDLLYVSDSKTNVVHVYSLPQAKLKQTLTGFKTPEGLCSDTKGDVFITNLFSEDVVEYAHGGTSPIKTLKDHGNAPFDCAVDSTTGNLAVANYISAAGRGNVAIYKRASGKPQAYADPDFYYVLYCTYDNKGDLFVVGANKKFEQSLAELPQDKPGLRRIALNRNTLGMGAVHWSGRALTIVAEPPHGVYRITISGSKGKFHGPTHLNHSLGLSDYAFYGTEIIGIDLISRFAPYKYSVKFWPYPKGGKATKAMYGFRDLVGLTVSLAPK